MNVKELIEELQKYPDDSFIVKLKFEGASYFCKEIYSEELYTITLDSGE